MSPLLAFSKDHSVWRYQKEMKCKWKQLRQPAPFSVHRYAATEVDGHEFEIDAVFLARAGMFLTRTVCYLDSSFVAAAMAYAFPSPPGYGGGHRGHFVYVEVGDTLLGVPSPGLIIRDYRMIDPIVQVWSRRQRQDGLTPNEPSAIEDKEIPLKYVPSGVKASAPPFTWRTKVLHPNPRDIRLENLEGERSRTAKRSTQ